MGKSRFHKGGMPSQRQLRVGELIRRTLADVLIRGVVHDPELNAYSITVSEVSVSPDLKIATAFVLPLGGKDKEACIAALAHNKTELKRAIGKEVTLKFVPDLRFVIDETFDKMDDTRTLLNSARVAKDLK